MKKVHELKDELAALVETFPLKLLKETEESLRVKPGPGKWSKIEVLGHLVDSALNNHQRWVRVLQGDSKPIHYQQDDWVRIQSYQTADRNSILDLWILLNHHLIWILNNTKEENFKMKYFDGEKEVSLNWLVEDYLQHLKHHLKQITHTHW